MGYHIKKSGTDFSQTASECLAASVDMAKVKRIGHKRRGFNRLRQKKRISCQRYQNRDRLSSQRMLSLIYPKAIAIIDIGGQDNKIIQAGRRWKTHELQNEQKMLGRHRSFLEEMSIRP